MLSSALAALSHRVDTGDRISLVPNLGIGMSNAELGQRVIVVSHLQAGYSKLPFSAGGFFWDGLAFQYGEIRILTAGVRTTKECEGRDGSRSKAI